MKKIINYLKSIVYRFVLWVLYGIGCFRSVSSQLGVIDEYSEENLEKEVEFLKKVCWYTGLDTVYLQRIVSIRLSAAILKLLELYGMDRKNRKITSSVDSLKSMVESWGGIIIETSESENFRYNGKSGYYWCIECDQDNKRRFELFSIIEIRGKELLN